MSKNPLGVDKGARPLMFIPALTTSASERMKTEGFRTLRVLPPGSARERQNQKDLAKVVFSHFCERAMPFTNLLQIRNKKLLTYVTIGGNI